MQSEQLTNLHPGWVIGGWLTAAAVTSGLYVGGAGLGLVRADATAVVWVSVSMAGGFFAGGLLVGMRWSDAPILHGAAITLFSVLVLFVLMLFGGADGIEPISVLPGMLLLQLVSSCAGGWMGRRVTLGKIGGQ